VRLKKAEAAFKTKITVKARNEKSNVPVVK
jgi:hypothetical protein